METVVEYNFAKEKLMALDKSVLVDALLLLAQESYSASLLVNGIIATQKERINLFNSYIKKVTFQEDLLGGEQILEILRRALNLLDPIQMDPKSALKLLESFYLVDSWAFESTTELDFEFDLLFSDQAYNLFCTFAKKCDDKNYVQQIANRLLLDDGYGVRAELKQFTLE